MHCCFVAQRCAAALADGLLCDGQREGGEQGGRRELRYEAETLVLVCIKVRWIEEE